MLQDQDGVCQGDAAVAVGVAGDAGGGRGLFVVALFTNAILVVFVRIDGFIPAGSAVPPVTVSAGEYRADVIVVPVVEPMMIMQNKAVHACRLAVFADIRFGAVPGFMTFLPDDRSTFNAGIPMVGVVICKFLWVYMLVGGGDVSRTALQTDGGRGAVGSVFPVFVMIGTGSAAIAARFPVVCIIVSVLIAG